MMFQQVVINSEECDEVGDGYGDGDRGDSPSSYAR